MIGQATAGAAQYLALAAAPVFALMGLLTFVAGDSHAALLCSEQEPFWLPTGMTPMYLLMAAFHLPPWLSLARRR